MNNATSHIYIRVGDPNMGCSCSLCMCVLCVLCARVYCSKTMDVLDVFSERFLAILECEDTVRCITDIYRAFIGRRWCIHGI